jgi:hypothetical protein
VKAQLFAILSFAAVVAVAAEPEIAPAAEGQTNIVSNIQRIKRWERQYVQFNPATGELIDPSGQLVKLADEIGRQNRANDLQQVTDAAHAGMTNALGRIYAMTNQVPERGISLRFSLKPSQERANFFAYIPKQTTDGTTDSVWYYFSHELKQPPKIQRRYRNGESTVFVEGVWKNYSTDGTTITDAQGIAWHGCNLCEFARPAFAVGYPSRPNRHPVLGHPTSGLDFAGATVYVDGVQTLTGYVTNGTERIYFDNGVYKGTEVIEQ